MAEITPQDLEITQEAPASYANRVIVNVGPVIRILVS